METLSEIYVLGLHTPLFALLPFSTLDASVFIVSFHWHCFLISLKSITVSCALEMLMLKEMPGICKGIKSALKELCWVSFFFLLLCEYMCCLFVSEVFFLETRSSLFFFHPKRKGCQILNSRFIITSRWSFRNVLLVAIHQVHVVHLEQRVWVQRVIFTKGAETQSCHHGVKRTGCYSGSSACAAE